MATANLALADGVFEIEQDGDTMIIVPVVDLRELDYERIEAGASEILELLDAKTTKNVVVDFGQTDYYGSSALSFFLDLLKKVRAKNGRMAFCNISAHEKEILKITNLDHSWPICASRVEALQSVKN